MPGKLQPHILFHTTQLNVYKKPLSLNITLMINIFLGGVDLYYGQYLLPGQR